jgi:8-hydroxy-5-deazaflavin:NADPH oxidoreductase
MRNSKVVWTVAIPTAPPAGERKDEIMKVAIIGAGNVGKALATAITRAGHDVTIAAKHPEHARSAAEEIGVTPAETNSTAAAGAEIIILAVPHDAAENEVAPEIKADVVGKPVIDVTNPLKPDLSGLATDRSAAEEIQERLPEAKVVKAFNTIFASRQADPSPDIDAFVAADDEKAKQQVISLAESMGFSPLDVGPLSTARFLEGMALINIGLNAHNGWSWTSAWHLER